MVVLVYIILKNNKKKNFNIYLKNYSNFIITNKKKENNTNKNLHHI